MSKLKVGDLEITITKDGDGELISLTDIMKGFPDSNKLIENWLRNKNTLEYLATWELLNNINFNSPEFDVIRIEAGTNKFLMSVNQWVTKTNAIGITANTGRYGGTFAHKDIAFHFCM